MKKYLTVFQLSFQNEFTYRLNFILWRVRNVLRILMVFFWWNSVFLQNKLAFGYDKQQMMAYVFLVLIVNTFVMSAPSNDNVGGQISNGDLSNFLVKPINYLHYWLTRDWASKLLNILFAVGEIFILYVLLKPQISISGSPEFLVFGAIAAILAALSYFYLTKIAIFAAFWAPEHTWGLMFVFLVLYEVLSGGIFPLDILPSNIFLLLKFTPFPYLVYFPIKIFIGNIALNEIYTFILGSVIWLIILKVVSNKLWNKGLKVYSSAGN